MHLPSDWKEFISLCNAHGVRYLIVGARSGRPKDLADVALIDELLDAQE